MNLNIFLLLILIGCQVITPFGFLNPSLKIKYPGINFATQIGNNYLVENTMQSIDSNDLKYEKNATVSILQHKYKTNSMQSNQSFEKKIRYENNFFTYQILKPIIYVIICEILVLPTFFAYHNFLEMIKNTCNNDSVAIIANNFF